MLTRHLNLCYKLRIFFCFVHLIVITTLLVNSIIPNWQEPDETLTERLWGLTEMLPECVRNACESTTDITINSTKTMYKFSCNASWIFFTSSMILFAPVLFETERAQMVELERSQKQQVWPSNFYLETIQVVSFGWDFLFTI